MNVPALRFPEFKGKWEQETLKNIVKINQGLQIPISERLIENGENRYFYITNEFLKKENNKKYYISNPVESVKCYKDDILMTRTGNTGIVISNVEGVFHNNFFKISYPSYIEKDYLIEFLRLFSTQKQIIRYAGTSTIPDLNHSDFYRLRLVYPSLEEQQKIADFLTAVDKKITQLTQKKALLEDYKKGCMQQLFNQQIRFKDDEGNDYPDWDITNFKNVFGWIKTNSLSRASLTSVPSEVQNIHYGDIHTKFKNNFNQLAEEVPYILDARLDEFDSKSFCKLGDVVIADASEDYNDIGKVIEITNLGETPLVAGLHTYIARAQEKMLIIGFSSYLFSSQNVRTQMMKIAQGISVLGVSKTNIEKIELAIPSNKEEQQKIASFLSALDKKIDDVQQQIEHTKQFKKGLLQQMFV